MNLNDIKEGELKEVFDALEQAFAQNSIDYYLIGAIARDIWYARGNKAFRGTKDVDFAALVGSRAEYDAVRQYLKEHKKFQDTKGNEFVMIAPSGVQIDILPFGEIEIDDSVELQGTGLTIIKANGFSEVHKAGTEAITTTTGHTFQVATQPSIILLKLIAFDDRPDQRLKDAGDVANIIHHFFELQNELMYSDENMDLYTDDDLDEQSVQEIAAIAIGRQIKKTIGANENLSIRIKAIHEKHIAQQEDSAFIRRMTQELEATVTTMVKWLNGILQGLNT